MEKRSVFWDDLERDMTDPQFREAFHDEVVRIRAVDLAMNDGRAELVAAAMCDSDYPDIAWGLLSGEAREKWMRRARAAIRALS